jgi:3,4-dihydroxy-2-butanone 4-phosphate synthase
MSLPVHQENPAPLPPRSANTFEFDSVSEAVEAFGRGEFVVVMDDEGRENEGDLVCAASKITVEGMAWFIRHSRYVARGNR